MIKKLKKTLKKSTILQIIIIVILTVVLIEPVIAAPNDLAKGLEYPPPFLKGERISVYVDGKSFHVDEPYYVIHGWIWDNWKDLSGEERKSILTEHWFELEIDYESIDMKKIKHYYKEVTIGTVVLEDVMVISYLVQFDAYEFDPGTYQFRGVWNEPSGISQQQTVDVEFTS